MQLLLADLKFVCGNVIACSEVKTQTRFVSDKKRITLSWLSHGYRDRIKSDGCIPQSFRLAPAAGWKDSDTVQVQIVKSMENGTASIIFA